MIHFCFTRADAHCAGTALWMAKGERMLETVFLPAAILLALIALGVLAAASLPGSAPSPRTVRTPVRVWCPGSGDLARLRVGVDVATRSLSVLWCERFADGAITCDRGCVPSEPLEAVA